ncbi:hypothetical protein KR032_007381 [Drosophila birchii]|nr:hypothetical protein KR032_007381 [Drosophila birchii]
MLTANAIKPPDKRADYQFIAGMAVGVVEACCLSPLDLVKSRLMVQGIDRVTTSDTYLGVRDAFSKIYRNEGLLSFWRGMVPQLLVNPPRRGFKFLLISLFRNMMQSGPHPTALCYGMAGALSGIIEAVVMNPFEVVKITQQVHQKKKQNALAMAKHIIAVNGYGLKGLNRGITAHIARNIVFQFTYFGIYINIRNRIKSNYTPGYELLRRFAIASFSGAVGLLLSAPLDMAKSRIQAPQPVRGVVKYGWALQTLKVVYYEEGLRSVYRGLTPLLMRTIPGGAIQIVSYEAIYDFLIETDAAGGLWGKFT